jgi:hypothetical protein
LPVTEKEKAIIENIVLQPPKTRNGKTPAAAAFHEKLLSSCLYMSNTSSGDYSSQMVKEERKW